MQLNTSGYTVGHDGLIYGDGQPFDGKIVEIEVAAGEVSEIKRGQIIDFAEEKYKLHATSGVPSAIAAETVQVDKSATKVQIEVYTSGTFKESGIVTAVELTSDDKETLRQKNIILK